MSNVHPESDNVHHRASESLRQSKLVRYSIGTSNGNCSLWGKHKEKLLTRILESCHHFFFPQEWPDNTKRWTSSEPFFSGFSHKKMPWILKPVEWGGWCWARQAKGRKEEAKQTNKEGGGHSPVLPSPLSIAHLVVSDWIFTLTSERDRDRQWRTPSAAAGNHTHTTRLVTWVLPEHIPFSTRAFQSCSPVKAALATIITRTKPFRSQVIHKTNKHKKKIRITRHVILMQ